MASTLLKNKTERMHQRISPEAKQVIERAASLRGVTVNDFVTSSAYEAATKTIKEHEVIQLTQKESERFVESFLNPPAPNAALRKLMKKKN